MILRDSFKQTPIMEKSVYLRPEGGYFVARLQLSECRSNIDDQHIESVQEQELILNRSGLPHDLASETLERPWICAKHRLDMGKNWRPRPTCQ